jgi:hypothetical protein
VLKREVIEDLVVLLRGFFSTPMISSLGRLGVLEAMRMATSFKVEDFHNVPNKKLLQDTFHYFARIGLIEDVDGQSITYRTSELGKEIFRRANSFYVPHSYYEYMYRYHELIQQSEPGVSCEVERLENVIGSGITHMRYFPPAISCLKRKVDFDVLVDVGCGDGQFLSTFVKDVPCKKVIGVDLSKLSTETTFNNLRRQYPGIEVSTICSDALDVKYWSHEVLRVSGKGRVAISMWFLLHEISKGRVDILIEFFRQIHQVFPEASVVVGEVVRQSEDILFKNSDKSLMSEYLLFHEISGQGILSWHEYKEVLNNISYELLLERLFDEAISGSGESIPSTFVWCLMPKQRV